MRSISRIRKKGDSTSEDDKEDKGEEKCPRSENKNFNCSKKGRKIVRNTIYNFHVEIYCTDRSEKEEIFPGRYTHWYTIFFNI